MSNPIRRYVLLALGLLTAAFVMSAQNSIRVQAPNVVAVDEQFNLTFIIEGEKELSSFSWEEGSDFQLVWGPQKGRSTSTSLVNGKLTHSSQSTYTYILIAKKAGNLTIPSATARIGGHTVSSNAAVIEVVEGGSQSSSGRGGGRQDEAATGEIARDDLFLRFSVSRTNVVVGEPVTATLKLYQRVNIAGFENARFPKFTGFWSQETFAPQQIEFKRETLDGVIYETALLRSYTLIPQQVGKLDIEPSELVCLVNVRAPRSTTNSIFDSFFDEGYRTIRKRVVSSGTTINVSRLPSGAPESFCGGVGSFSITGALSRNELKTHDAASLVLTVSGKGNISLLEAPKVNFPPDFDVYDVKTTDKTDRAGAHVSGSKVFEYPFIPRSHGEFVIAPVKYSYYDVNAGRYVTVSTDSLRVSVGKGAQTEGESPAVRAAAPVIGRKDVKNLGEDIRYISTSVPSLVKKGSFFVGSLLFWLLCALVIFLSAAFYLIYKSLEARRADVAGSKKRQASKMARKRLSRAGVYLKDNLYTAFYEELHRALLGFASDKLNMDSTDMTKENIAASLISSGVGESLASSFNELLDACEFARYAPNAGHEAMNSHYEAAVEVITSIDSNMKKRFMDKSAVSALCALFVLFTALSPSQALAQAQSQAQAQFLDSHQPMTQMSAQSQSPAQEPVQAQAQAESLDSHQDAADQDRILDKKGDKGPARIHALDVLWLQAADHYSNGRWDEAVSCWSAISDAGMESPELYCNLANAYFKKSEYAEAVLFYERSLKLDPSFKDARANLDFVAAFLQDRIESVPEFVLKTWFRNLCWSMSSTAWALLFLGLLLLTCTLVLVFLLSGSRAGRTWSFFGGIAALLFSVVSLSFSFWQKSDYEALDEAVVMVPVSSVKSAPGSESTKDLFVLHEGTKVLVLETVGESWNKIELPDGRQGWMRAGEMEFI